MGVQKATEKFEIFPIIPSPFRCLPARSRFGEGRGEGEGGRRLREPLARRGVDKGVLVLIGSPLPFTLLDKALYLAASGKSSHLTG